jgi:hypothetical protein
VGIVFCLIGMALLVQDQRAAGPAMNHFQRTTIVTVVPCARETDSKRVLFFICGRTPRPECALISRAQGTMMTAKRVLENDDRCSIPLRGVTSEAE